ncbi:MULTISPECIES: type VII secretion protein EccB [Streptomyces]|uniref:Type VII secretion protein EccB n=1 Tax=Streptomyces solicathayae TaxID=3081768 RepID=A0ABZ0LRC4_9ACTN|nr:type VII secretion protein EccB [Streptomyces sp. HUAS YS2]WOX21756.1 type VII secretion protein EccB [Streptomyces sp. HUAS YS2]
MAARRDELGAYTFAKRRTVAAFLRPSPSGTDDGAPAPLRAVVPSIVAGALLLAGFGAWGMLQPKAPKGWDTPGTRVVVGKQSTTRYVVLTTGEGKDRRTLLHPVLNLASARLLLDPSAFDVVQVDDEVLDAGRPPRGPILGIPYAPDRLPTEDEAGRAKRWAVCAQPGGSATASVQKAAFVLAERDFPRTEGRGRKLAAGEVLYVKGQKGALRYLVDATGTKYQVRGAPAESAHLATVLVGVNREPQSVTDDWLATLHTGSPVDFPVLPGRVGAPAGIGGGLSETEDRVGMVLRAGTGAGPQHYVVLPGKVQPVSDFTAWLLVHSPQTQALDMDGRPTEVGSADFPPDTTAFGTEHRWPVGRVRQVNGTDGEGARDTVCSVLRAVDGKGRTTLSTWAGTEYPAEIAAGGPGTYVTPGSGLLYTQVRSGGTGSDGSLFLVTDTGLRYAVRTNGEGQAGEIRSEARIRLGYGDVTPALVPAAWSDFLSKGPRLDTDGARRPQGS